MHLGDKTVVLQPLFATPHEMANGTVPTGKLRNTAFEARRQGIVEVDPVLACLLPMELRCDRVEFLSCLGMNPFRLCSLQPVFDPLVKSSPFVELLAGERYGRIGPLGFVDK